MLRQTERGVRMIDEDVKKLKEGDLILLQGSKNLVIKEVAAVRITYVFVKDNFIPYNLLVKNKNIICLLKNA